MSVSANLQQQAAARLAEPGALRVAAPVIVHRERELAKEIEAAAARGAGLCVYARPALPTRAVEDVPFPFFDQSDFRVRIIEQPARNQFGADAYELAADVMNALHWWSAPSLSCPLQLAARCTESVSDQSFRVVDVIFAATYQLPSRSVPAVALQLTGNDLCADLQQAVIAQLNGAMETPLVAQSRRNHDLANEIARSGNPLNIEVLTPLPVRAMQGNPEAFFEGMEVRVKIAEQPALNAFSFNAYDVVEDVAATLHWQPFAGLLAYPLALAASPTALTNTPARREIDVIFNAVTGFVPE